MAGILIFISTEHNPISSPKKSIHDYYYYLSHFSDFNKGGDPIWYYNSQGLKPQVQEKFKEMEIIPFDNPP